jgi:putative N-acetylmannosamine-6-phosphate epimerase
MLGALHSTPSAVWKAAEAAAAAAAATARAEAVRNLHAYYTLYCFFLDELS